MAGRRDAAVRVRTAKRRKPSSTRWLRRQLNDPYVAEARRQGWRGRAAFKLMEIDDKFRLLRPGAWVLDLGAAPGGWTQVAVARARPRESAGRVVALDRIEMDPVDGAEALLLDVHDEDALACIRAALGGRVDLVLSDMSPAATGHAGTDHLRIMGLVEAALEVARVVLAPGGALVAKVFSGGTEAELLAVLKRLFASVRHVKPPASRAESVESYVVATGFRG
jgi:23S rRNA (uridine2552-2'-O)-methyltransferase